MKHSSQVVIGLDVGGTKTQAVAFSRKPDGGLDQLAEHQNPTDVGDAEAVTASVLGSLASLIERLDSQPITSIGLGIPGLIDRDTGRVRQAVNLGIGDQPLNLVDKVKAIYDVPCDIDNDVNVAALGAYHLLWGDRDDADLAFLSLGTGIAAGVILNGQIHRGHRGVAGEIGHLPVVPDGPPCECGLQGCLETVASGSAMARLWPTATGRLSAESLVTEAARGNQRACAVLESVTDHLAKAIYLLAITYDIDQVVIGGGVGDLGADILNPIKEALRRLEARSSFVASLALPSRIISKPNGPVAALGAALLTKRNHLS